MSLKDEPLDLAESLLRAYEVQIRDFVNVAKQFCNTIEARKNLTQVGFLQVVEQGLVALYAAALALPDDRLWWNDDADDQKSDGDDPVGGNPESSEEFPALSERIQTEKEAALPSLAASRIAGKQLMAIEGDIRELVGDFDLYLEVFNPYGEPEAIHGSLSDDLGSIYADVKVYLPLLESDEITARREALWNYRFGFDSHWGEHLTGALRAVYSLIRNQRFNWDDDEWEKGRLKPFEFDEQGQ